MKQFNPAELSPAGGSQDIRPGDRWITVEIQPHLYGLYFCQSQRCEGRQRLAIYIQAFSRGDTLVHWFTCCHDCNRNMHAVERESR